MSTGPLITGIGVVAPTGFGADAHWAATLAGRSAIGPLRRFDTARYPVRLAGEVDAVDPAELIPGRLVPQTDRWTQLALVAAEQALADAAVDPAALPEYEAAVLTGSSSGGVEFGQREIERLWSRGPDHVGAYQSIAWFYAATTGQISIRHGMRGPCGVLVSEQASGLDSLGYARWTLQDGARLVVAGGTDAPFSPYGLVCQMASGMLSRSHDPASAYTPFATGAQGYVPGEGGAILIMEDPEAAAERGCRGYGTVSGYAATFDPAPDTGRMPTLRRAIEGALADAQVEPSDVDVVFADGAGVPDRDVVEANAIADVFGDGEVPVTVPKTMTGRLYAGGAPLDVATALLAMRDSVIPPTVGVHSRSPDCPIDLVLAPRRQAVRTALVIARGYSGFNSALVLRAAPTGERSTGRQR